MANFERNISIIAGFMIALSSTSVVSAQTNAKANSTADIYFEMAEIGRTIDGADQEDLDNYLRACENDHSLACRTAGYYLISGKIVQRDAEQGLDLYHKSCDLGDINGCLAASAVYRMGDGIPKNPRKAAELEAKACQLAENTQEKRLFC